MFVTLSWFYVVHIVTCLLTANIAVFAFILAKTSRASAGALSLDWLAERLLSIVSLFSRASDTAVR